MPSSHRHRDRLATLVLAGGAAIAVAIIAVHAPGFGDYPRDAGPAITPAAHGNFAAFFAHQPAMGALSLYLRVPFAALGVALGDDALGVYRWASLPCLIALALVAVWLARVAGRRGAGHVAQALIVGMVLLNPLVGDALYWGHPEEILTAALATGALLAALEQRALATALLAGLAIASKQWALVTLIPALLLLDRDRLRAGAGAIAIAVLSTLPMIIGNLASFRHVLRYISSPQPLVTVYTWLYPFSSTGNVRISDINGARAPFTAHQILPIETLLSHPLIVAVGLALPVYVWWRAQGRPGAGALLIATALALLLRCALDPGSVAYYHLPLLLVLVTLDAWEGRTIPVTALAATAVAFVVLDRFPRYLSAQATNAAYIAVTVVATYVLVRELRSDRAIPLMTRRAEPIRAS